LAIVGTSLAGYGSTRLAGNPPSHIPGKTLIERGSARAGAKSRDRVVGESGMAVDTPEDLERVRAFLAPEKGSVA
jgi:CMP-2-keto-3-deoxyoctulosonic acid synthetase